MKILADRNMAGVAGIFAPLGEVELFDGRALTSAAGADLLLVRSVTRVDEALLGGHRPRFIGSATSGIDHVDLAALNRLGIPFAYAPGSNADSVVDYVLSALCQADDCLARLLAGEPLGIIGYGHIGRRLHQRLARLGIVCRAYDPWLSRADSPILTALDALLECPAVCLHASLTRDAPWPSFHMLAAESLARLPESALLINAGRGELVATEELLALHDRRGDIAMALDVWEGEPAVAPALLDACRFGTAHIAGYSHDGKLRATWMLYRAACRALERDDRGEPWTPGPVKVVVPELPPGGRSTISARMTGCCGKPCPTDSIDSARPIAGAGS
jgi:erythronate-4-phosphate dehydrogenase